MISFLNNYIYTFILILFFYLSSKNIFNNFRYINFKKVIVFIWISFFLALSLSISSINIQACVFIAIIFLFNKLLFKSSNRKNLFTTIIYYISLVISDSILKTFIILHNDICPYKEIIFSNNSLIYNVIGIIISYFIITFLHNCYNDAIVSNSKFALRNIFTFILAFITSTSLLILKIPSLNFQNLDIIINIAFLIIFILMALLYLIKDILYAKDIYKDYQNTMKYVKDTEKLLEEYRFSVHENRNQLIMIRNMLNKKTDKSILEYIDSLIEYKNELDTLDSWTFKNLSNIPFIGLKEFIDYKFSEMQNENIELETIVSKDIKTLNEKILTTKDKEDLYSIIGIIIDNAKEALTHSQNKQFSFQMYLNDKNINLVFANTFYNSINSSKIFLSGFTNKGPKHGNGLTIAKKLTSKNSKFDLITEIIDDFFVQTLIIKTENHHKTTKNHQN